MYHNDLELICYSNDLPYLNARKGFKPQNNLKWKMEKRTENDILNQNLKYQSSSHCVTT